jgi:hypothetical protein
MMTSASLCIERQGTEQVVRAPRPTDALGAALRNAFPTGAGLPDDWSTLLSKLDGAASRH